ncbi:MAG: hypothetical protein K2H53_01180, partial [Clostridia bacterium]|nr:hypothetical protein [Clostridia bacterium]
DTTTSVGEAGGNTFHVKFTPNDTKNYNTIASIEVTVTVSAIDPSYDVPSGLTANYNQTLADVTLPTATNGTFTWVEDTTTSVGEAGGNTFHVKFTPNDTKNYNTIASIEVTVTVNPKPVASVSVLYPQGKDSFEYGDGTTLLDNLEITFIDNDGEEIDLDAINENDLTTEAYDVSYVVEWYKVTYAENSAEPTYTKVANEDVAYMPTDAGKYVAKVIATAKADGNYSTKSIENDVTVNFIESEYSNICEITKITIKDMTIDELVTITGIDDNEQITYTGTTPELTITPVSTEITVDAVPSYQKLNKTTGKYENYSGDPIDVGSYRVGIVVSGTGNYTGSVKTEEIYFDIVPREITIRPIAQEAVYGANEITLNQTKYEVTEIINGTEQKVELPEGQIITGIILTSDATYGKGETPKTAKSYDILISGGKVEIGNANSQAPEGDETVAQGDQTPTVGAGFDITFNYTINLEDLEDGFTIHKKLITDEDFKNGPWSASIVNETDYYVYSGSPKSVKVETPEALVKDQDIEIIITYKKSGEQGTTTQAIDVGTYFAYVTVKGIGNYDGERVLADSTDPIRFTITKRKPELLQKQIPVLTAKYGDTIADAIWTFKDLYKDGQEDKELLGTFTFHNSVNTSNLVGSVGEGNGTEVTLVYTPADTVNYDPIDNIKVKIQVSQATPDYDDEIVLEATYGQTLENIKSQLPEGYTFEAPLTTSVGVATNEENENAEGNTVKVTYTPFGEDAANYEVVSGIDVTINVEKADQTAPVVTLSNGKNNTVLMTEKNVTVNVTNTEDDKGNTTYKGDITYTIADGEAEDVLTIDEVTGAITLNKFGDTKVIVTFTGNSNYKPASTSIDIAVRRDALKDGDFEIKGTKEFTYSEGGNIEERNSVIVGPFSRDVDGYGDCIIKYYDGETLVASSDGKNGDLNIAKVPVNAGTYTVKVDIKAGTKYIATAEPLNVGTMTIKPAVITTKEEAKEFLNISVESSNTVEWSATAPNRVYEFALKEAYAENQNNADITKANCIRYTSHKYNSDPNILGINEVYLRINSKNIKTDGDIKIGQYTVVDTIAPTFTNTETEVSISEEDTIFDYAKYADGTDNHDSGTLKATWVGEVEKDENGNFISGETYDIVYILRDSSGNTTIKTVKVTVTDAPPRIYYIDRRNCKIYNRRNGKRLGNNPCVRSINSYME